MTIKHIDQNCLGLKEIRGIYMGGVRIFTATLFLIIMMQTPLHAWMAEMDDEDMQEVTGAGFSSFDINNNVCNAYFNITARTFTEINSMKMGYYDDGISYGWDQDWVNVSLGSASEDLVCKGMYIETAFSNIASDQRELKTMKVGTHSMTGPISADFVSFSGHIENPSEGVLVEGKRLNLGARTIYSTNSEFFMSFSKEDAALPEGWWCYWNNATITP